MTFTDAQRAHAEETIALVNNHRANSGVLILLQLSSLKTAVLDNLFQEESALPRKPEPKATEESRRTKRSKAKLLMLRAVLADRFLQKDAPRTQLLCKAAAFHNLQLYKAARRPA